MKNIDDLTTEELQKVMDMLTTVGRSAEREQVHRFFFSCTFVSLGLLFVSLHFFTAETAFLLSSGVQLLGLLYQELMFRSARKSAEASIVAVEKFWSSEEDDE